MNYCSNVWGLGSKHSVNSIFIAQKKAIRSIGNGYFKYFYNKKTLIKSTKIRGPNILNIYHTLHIINLGAIIIWIEISSTI